MSEFEKEQNERYEHIQKGIHKLEDENTSIKTENEQLKQRVNELTALCYQVTNHFENEFFNNQSIVRAIRDKLVMNPDVWAIVNKSKEQQDQSANS